MGYSKSISIFTKVFLVSLKCSSIDNHLICFSGRRCNNLPRLFGDEQERFDNVFSSVEEKGLYSVPALLKSKSFHMSFGTPKPMVSGEGNNGEDRPTDVVSSSDAGESRHSRDEHPQRDIHSRDESKIIRNY